jgi:hypothetical protein
MTQPQVSVPAGNEAWYWSAERSALVFVDREAGEAKAFSGALLRRLGWTFNDVEERRALPPFEQPILATARGSADVKAAATVSQLREAVDRKARGR